MARQGYPAKPAGGHGAGRQRHRHVALNRPHGYALPASALSRVGDKPAVFVITPQSQAQLRVVVPAYYTATSVIIAPGLEPGDRVITAGVSKLRSGEPVIAGEVQP
jgi:multidrug efflux pump subunit AcrA (membrane-fusion protein)